MLSQRHTVTRYYTRGLENTPGRIAVKTSSTLEHNVGLAVLFVLQCHLVLHFSVLHFQRPVLYGAVSTGKKTRKALAVRKSPPGARNATAMLIALHASQCSR